MSKKRIEWHVEQRKISDLKPYDKNPRIINEHGLDLLANSFDTIGMAQPININTDNVILSGHARWMQLKREGAEFVDVYVPDRLLTPKQEEAVIILMNKANAGEWNIQMLNESFEHDDLLEWGFKHDELVFAEIIDPVIEDQDEVVGEDENKKYVLQVTLPNDMELRDLYDDLVSKGYIVREM